MPEHEIGGVPTGRSTSSSDDVGKPAKRVMTAARKEQNRVAQKAYRQRQRELRQALRVNIQQRDKGKLPMLRPQGETCPNRCRFLDNSQINATAHGACQVAAATAADVTPSTPGALLLPSNVQSGTAPTLPCLDRRTMCLVPTTIASAVFENALSLGYDLNRLAECRGDYVSPFYQPLASPDNDPEALISTSVARVTSSSRSRTIPVHLRPTLAQVLIAHDASLDLIPLPFLRERAILMSALMPDTFNLWELKFDIYHRGGLMLWQVDRSGQGNSSACSSYQPWDMRSWEAMPWFLQKWCMVIGGKESPFWKQSTWWHRMRGVEHG
ncbi:hypothetical protein B0J13DRAFT_506356 [Dactylonectria estremocensis]|uniref:BZIP domain-containing protein n=1 Tax=Dactylonectria estremocensis TaxID=1079267 RepID=A0A9P9EFW9_9HYPO|nr:hypothetical protein B0J13DRAFT_506356 [Dactylonectria estremocensis]